MTLKGFTLEIPESAEDENGYVALHDAQRYSIKLGNDNGLRCDVELFIDGFSIGVFRLPENASCLIERPLSDNGFFTFYDLKSEGAKQAGLSASNDDLGLIKAVFMPEIPASESLVLNAAPIIADNLSAGGTGLSGHSNQNFSEAKRIKLSDESDWVTLYLRLACKPSDVRSLHPAPVASQKPPAIHDANLGKATEVMIDSKLRKEIERCGGLVRTLSMCLMVLSLFRGWIAGIIVFFVLSLVGFELIGLRSWSRWAFIVLMPIMVAALVYGVTDALTSNLIAGFIAVSAAGGTLAYAYHICFSEKAKMIFSAAARQRKMK